METRLANIERQLGRKLTANEHSLMELWCQKFKEKPEKSSHCDAQADENAQPAK
jgi:hypothetical protein